MPFESEWEDIHQKYFWGTQPNPYLLKFLDEHFEHNKPLTFLDLGCGTGANTIPLLERGWNVYAVDGSFTALCRLAQRIDQANVHGKVVLFHADINSLEFKENSLDCVIDGNSTSQMPLEEVVRVTQAARRWLKLGGRFYSNQLAEPYDPKFLKAYTRFAKIEDMKVLFRGYEGVVHKLQGTHVCGAVTSYFEFRMQLVRRITEVPDFDLCDIYNSDTRPIMSVVENQPTS